ncbi:putative superfamily III holin-X, partial [Arthrobacter sp. AG367]
MSSQIPEMPPSAAHVKADNASLGELLGDVTRDLSTLMRQEVELAKAELKQSTSRAGKGAGMLAGAGVGGHFVLLFLSLALMWALGA